MVHSVLFECIFDFIDGLSREAAKKRKGKYNFHTAVRENHLEKQQNPNYGADFLGLPKPDRRKLARIVRH